MITDTIKSALEKTSSDNSLFIHTRIKEILQDYILNYVYNHRLYKHLIFTGGTCLRKVYGLPRLSEDIDFDFVSPLQIPQFAKELVDYFTRQLQYDSLETKIAANGRTIFVKFPTLLRELGLVKSNADRQQLFVRCDFAPEIVGVYETEIHQVTTAVFTFFVKSYNLPTLFANKVIAFLQRDYFRGYGQTIAFKGRDLFDLVWLLEQSRKERLHIKPAWNRIKRVLPEMNKQQIINRLVDKVRRIDPKDVKRDLAPFIESAATLQSFSAHFADLIAADVKNL